MTTLPARLRLPFLGSMKIKQTVLLGLLLVSLLGLITYGAWQFGAYAPLVRVNSTILGTAQKGPFIIGSQVTLVELNAQLAQTGKTYVTTTSDNLGSFRIDGVASEYAEIIVAGYFFDEIYGELTEAPITLRAIVQVNPDNHYRVNVLTTLAAQRIKRLVTSEQIPFEQARAQAEGEVLRVFNINPIGDSFDSMDISQQSDKGAILLAISAILLNEQSVSGLSELVATMAMQIEEEGRLYDDAVGTELLGTLQMQSQGINVAEVVGHLQDRYDTLQASADVPDISPYIKKIVTPQILTVSPANDDKDVPVDAAITLEGSKDILSPVAEDAIVVTAGEQVITGQISVDESLRQLTFTPDGRLPDDTLITVSIGPAFKFIGADSLPEGYAWSFTTIGIKLEQDLVAHYTFDGNFDDASSDKQGTHHGASFTADRFDEANNALYLGDFQYLEIPSVVDLWEAPWTVSMWIKPESDQQVGYDQKVFNYGEPQILAEDYYREYQETQFTSYFSILQEGTGAYSIVSENASAGTIAPGLTPEGRWRARCLDDCIATGEWQMVTLVYDNTELQYFVNGKRVSTSPSDGYYDSPISHRFDKSYEANSYFLGFPDVSAYQSPYSGGLDDLSIYKRALNESEVQQLFLEGKEL